jgi:hypothetical protein
MELSMGDYEKLLAAYGKLEKVLRQHRARLMDSHGESWPSIERIYLSEDFDKTYWTPEERIEVSPEIRALLIGVLMTSELSDEQFEVIKRRYLNLKRGMLNAISEATNGRTEGDPDLVLLLVSDTVSLVGI